MDSRQTTSSFGRRVAKERDQRDWSLRKLGRLSGLSYSRIHRIETDADREVTIDDAVRLADAFGMPIAWLVQGSQVRDRVLAAARTQDTGRADEAIDEVLPVLELAAQLDELDNITNRISGVPDHPRGDQDPREWGRQVAETLRRDWSLPAGPLLNLAGMIEERTPIMVAVAPLPEGVDGLALTDPETQNTLIAVRETDNWERQRFTLAHELGHLLAGDRLIEAVGPDKASSPIESAASEFARNLLVPLGDLRALDAERNQPWDGFAVAEAAWRYQVSPAVLAIQLSRAGLAPDSLVERVARVSADTWSNVGGWAPERQSLAAASATRRVPPRLVSRALHAWQQSLIPTATIARLLHQEPDLVGAQLSELGIEQTADAAATGPRC